MQKVAKKSIPIAIGTEAPPAGQAHAHEQSLYLVITSIIEAVGRTPCVVLFETQIGACLPAGRLSFSLAFI